MATDVKTLSFHVSALAAGTALLWKCPDDTYGGGITILEAFLSGTGTITAALLTGTNVGTPVINGTVIASAAATVVPNVPLEKSVADGWVDGGEWLMYNHSAGSALIPTFLILNYTDVR